MESIVINDNIVNPNIKIIINNLNGNLIIIKLDNIINNITWNDITKIIRIKLEENNKLNYISGIKLIHDTIILDGDDNINIINNNNEIHIQLLNSSIMLKNDINQSINMLLDNLYKNYELNNLQKEKLFEDLIKLLNNIIINSIEALDEFTTILLNRVYDNNELQDDYINLIILFKDKFNFQIKNTNEIIECNFRRSIVNMLQNKFETHLNFLKKTEDINNINNHKLLI